MSGVRGGTSALVFVILLRAFVMALELGLVKLFAITISVFDSIIVVYGIARVHLSFVELSVGKLFLNDGSNLEHR